MKNVWQSKDKSIGINLDEVTGYHYFKGINALCGSVPASLKVYIGGEMNILGGDEINELLEILKEKFKE